jgi:hypothetical protein
MFKIEGTKIYLTRGDSAEFNINIIDADGNPYELQEGDLVEFTIKEDIYSSDALIYKTGTTIVIEPSDTSRLRYGTYVYDVQVTLSDGTVDTIIPPSEFKVLSEVTF